MWELDFSKCWLSRNKPVAQRVRAFASRAEGLVFEFQPQETQVVKAGSDSSTAKRSAIGVLGDDHYKGMPRVTVGVAR